MLDSFRVLVKDLLSKQRSMQTLFTPHVRESGEESGLMTPADPELAKTTFQVSALLKILEDLSMHRYMMY